MQDPSTLYRLETDTLAAEMAAPVLVVSFDGFIDAGRTQKLVTDHLLSSLDHTVVATFDIDQLVDYRARRPAMVFDHHAWASYADPSLALYRLVDDNGRPFLLLAGLEPDYQWERVVAAVQQLIERLGVDLTVFAHGIPMATPHTRPLGVTRHATTEELRRGEASPLGSVGVPAGLQSLLELRLQEAGAAAVGFAVHVPHYLSSADCPPAALVALGRIGEVAQLSLPDSALLMAASEHERLVETELGSSPEAAQLVSALERHYDQESSERGLKALASIDESSLPSADDLGRQFEAFLRAEAAGVDGGADTGAGVCGPSDPGVSGAHHAVDAEGDEPDGHERQQD